MSDAADDTLNIANHFLTARIDEGRGDRTALLVDDETYTYQAVEQLAARFARALERLGVEPEQRVLVALPDGVEFAGALFGTLKLGAAVVMLNCHLKADDVEYFYRYTRAKVAVVHRDHLAEFLRAASGVASLKRLLVVGGAGDDDDRVVDFDTQSMPDDDAPLSAYPTHRDDAAIWLFSGGTTGRPKAVVQTHGAFVNTTRLYAHNVLGYREDDITLSVPKLYFGYATGSNLLFPFSVGAAAIVFPQRCTAAKLLELIARHRPTILINVPTMIGKLLAEADDDADLSSLRFATSAGEALPVELYNRWKARFGVELLDGLGTAEMWHVFVTNRMGDVKPGTLGRVVDGFELEARDDVGNPVAAGETGWLWVAGDSRALGYWQQHSKSQQAFRGRWYVSGDMISIDADGYVTYAGRGDDMLKVGGKWLAPAEVENCLLTHEAVKECAVVGVEVDGLIKPHAFVVVKGDAESDLAERLMQYVREQLEPYKAPRRVRFMPDLPRTHLGKIDRGQLRHA